MLNNWVVQRYYIPSGSMENTIMPHDYVLTSKLVPDSIEINRGDIVVFNDSGNWLGEHEQPELGWFQKALIWSGLRPDPGHQQLIKRVIGLPGDTVTCCNASGLIEVNGTEIDEPYLKSGVVPSLAQFSVTVPEDRYWVMGDNRSNSADSRAHQDNPGDGTIPRSDVLGKAVAVVWPFSRIQWLTDYSDVFSSVPAGARVQDHN
ncbi:signal peptidase I [Boudabousia marimammalium]|uniref:Signal peptidase I n=2 Tax=Boudabousia marimammalium TaxID=156892 RepID=A0A1Q5PS10_9ACTO|nr:signal peptidase I [Boudabousia marimammalium]